MSTTYTHTRVSLVDSYGNIEVLYPQNTASDVMVSRSSGSVIPSTVSTAQDAFLDIYNSLGNVTTDLTGVVAPEFSESATYTVGKYVLHDNVLYRCTTAVTTPGTWATHSSKFTSDLAMDEVQALVDDMNSVNGKIPTTASTSNKLATASDITDITGKIPSAASTTNQLATASDITGITGKIPSNASTSNKMATASDITTINNKIGSTSIASIGDGTITGAIASLGGGGGNVIIPVNPSTTPTQNGAIWIET